MRDATELEANSINDYVNRISVDTGVNFHNRRGERGMIDWIFCHLIGDYVLQIDFIAKTKGENWYHLLVHCLLYILPFRIVYGVDWRLIPLLITHIIIDALKARYKKLTYTQDQIAHYMIAFLLYAIVR